MKLWNCFVSLQKIQKNTFKHHSDCSSEQIFTLIYLCSTVFCHFTHWFCKEKCDKNLAKDCVKNCDTVQVKKLRGNEMMRGNKNLVAFLLFTICKNRDCLEKCTQLIAFFVLSGEDINTAFLCGYNWHDIPWYIFSKVYFIVCAVILITKRLVKFLWVCFNAQVPGFYVISRNNRK